MESVLEAAILQLELSRNRNFHPIRSVRLCVFIYSLRGHPTFASPLCIAETGEFFHSIDSVYIVVKTVSEVIFS